MGRLVLGVVGRMGTDVEMQVLSVNGLAGLVFTRGDALVGVVALDVAADGRIAAIDVQMNPEKLAHLHSPLL